MEGFDLSHDLATSCRQVLDRLNAQQVDLINDVVSDCGYGAADAATLIDAIKDFVEDLPSLRSSAQAQLEFENDLLRRISPAARISLRPWGRVLFVCPSNAPAPLAAIAPLALALSGNRVTVVSPSATRASVARCVSLLRGYQVQLWEGSTAEAISTIEELHYDMVYYTGSSRFFSEIASSCARSGTHLIFEGEGKGIAVVSKEASSADLIQSAKDIGEALRYCNGKMCSKPTALAIPSEIETYFVELLTQAVRESHLPETTDKILDAALVSFIEERVSAGDLELLTPLDGTTPCLIRARNSASAIEKELFGPVLALFTYDSIECLRSELAAHRHRLQLSWFGPTAELLPTADAAGVARVCSNLQPSSQDPSLPWGGYGLSGTSDVLDFYRKGLRRVLNEYG